MEHNLHLHWVSRLLRWVSNTMEDDDALVQAKARTAVVLARINREGDLQDIIDSYVRRFRKNGYLS